MTKTPQKNYWPNTALIVAHGDNGEIGLNNDLPWPRIKEDMKHFRETTTDHIVVMGRNTWESLNETPLKNRVNIVVSTTLPAIELNGVYENSPLHFVHSIPAALGKAYAEYPGKTIFFIGGAKLYNSVCNMVEKLIITQVPGTWEADTYFDSNDDSVIKGTFVHTDVEDKVLVENYKDGKPIKVKVFQQFNSAVKSQRYGDAEPPRPKLTTLKWMRYRPKAE